MPRKPRGKSEIPHVRLDLEGDIRNRFFFIQEKTGIQNYADVLRHLITTKSDELGYKIRVEEPSQSQSEVAPQNQSQPRSEED